MFLANTQPFNISKSLLPNYQTLLNGMVLLFLISFTSTVLADRETLPLASNLQQLGQKAASKNIPIALLFTSKGLKSTSKLKDEAILPALYSGKLEGKVLLREVEVNTDATTIDFYGEKMANKEFKSLYNLTSLPVVLFVNADGDQIHEPLLSGAYDYYFFYLKDSINASLKALGNTELIE